MKYVCKNMFTKYPFAGSKNYGVIYVYEGDILEYLGVDKDGLCEFITDKGNCIKLNIGEANYFLEKVKLSYRDKISCLLDRVSEIENEIGKLKVELEDIMRETE